MRLNRIRSGEQIRLPNLPSIFFLAISFLLSGCGRNSSPEESSATVPQIGPLKDRISALTQPLIDGGWAEGLIVGVLQDGKRSYFPYGSLGDESNGEPNENAVFEIGSITKVFTALALADLVAQKEVSLEDPVANFLPDDWSVPTPGGRPITLGSLADHTSGLPMIPANFWKPGDKIYDGATAGRRWSEYSARQFREFFKAPNPALDQQRKYVYSNLGMGLLGHALARQTGKSLDELIQSRICRPLGMKQTSFTIPTTGSGHDVDGKPAAAWTAGDSVLQGAFALRSTCADLLQFAECALDPAASPLAEAMALAQKSRVRINEVEQSALGWKVNKFGVIYTAGATGGFRCALFLHPQTRTAVVLMANTLVGGSTGGRAALFDALAGSLLNVSLGVPPLKIDFPMPDENDSTPLTDYVGAYRAADAHDLNFPIRVENGQLTTVGPGGVEMVIWPQSKDAFFARAYLSEFKFQRNEAGSVTGIDLTFEGRKSKLKRSERPGN